MTDLERFAEYLREKAKNLEGHGVDDFATGLVAAAADAELFVDHIEPAMKMYLEDDYPCASGCKPSEGDVCGGPRCT